MDLDLESRISYPYLLTTFCCYFDLEQVNAIMDQFVGMLY
jgi:hypothetical protein